MGKDTPVQVGDDTPVQGCIQQSRRWNDEQKAIERTIAVIGTNTTFFNTSTQQPDDAFGTDNYRRVRHLQDWCSLQWLGQSGARTDAVPVCLDTRAIAYCPRSHRVRCKR